MAEIVLIQPYTGSWDEMSIRFPESLLAIAAVPVSKGYDVRIIDQRVSDDFEQELEDAVGPETRIFGVTAITGEQIGFALKVSRLLKDRFPHIPLCWGGVHATLVPEQTAAHPLIDYVVVGDGEYVLCELYERLRDGKTVEDLRGLIYKSKEGVHSNAGAVEMLTVGKEGSYTFVRRNGQADLIRNMDALPHLPYHLLNLDAYSVFQTEDGRRSATLNTSRGCPFRCKFCSDPVINEGHWRGFSAPKLLEKVSHLVNDFNVGMIYFQDDYFPGSKTRFIEVLKGLAAYERKLLWATAGIRADILAKCSDEEFDLLYRSGCHSLEIGIETGNERVLKLVNKGETLDEMRAVNARLAKYGIKVKYTLIVGFPTETKEEVEDTLRFAAELERVNPNAYCLIMNFLPIIGTPFYFEALKQGFQEPRSLEEWAHMEFDNWMKHYRSWASPELINWLQAINFVSFFHNSNVKYKFSGSWLLRLSFALYHPVAAWRFRNNFYGFFIEHRLKQIVLGAKYQLRQLTRALKG
jgi:anaerobic magnesium-protoporphyrin IX monomethyl ester cyclase